MLKKGNRIIDQIINPFFSYDANKINDFEQKVICNAQYLGILKKRGKVLELIIN